MKTHLSAGGLLLRQLHPRKLFLTFVIFVQKTAMVRTNFAILTKSTREATVSQQFLTLVSLNVHSMSLDGVSTFMQTSPFLSFPIVPITPTSRACPVRLNKQIGHFTGTAAVI